MRQVTIMLLAAAMLLATAASSFAADSDAAAVSLPAKSHVHIYLLMGQSNMSGRGHMLPEDHEPVANIYMMDKEDQWVPAHHPLHFDKKIAAFGMGLPFAKKMLVHLREKDSQAVVGLVPCAFGGTPLSRWVKGGDLYENAVRRAKIAVKAGEIDGMLWHQGESDTGSAEHADTYGQRLAGMIVDLRKDLDSAKLPVVVGQLVPSFVARTKLASVVNEALADLPKHVPHTACASADGLKDRGDRLHFDRESQIELGHRYFLKMIGLQASP